MLTWLILLIFTAQLASPECIESFVEPSNAARTSLSISDDVECVQCATGCKTCDEDLDCSEMWEAIDGAEINANGDIEGVCGTAIGRTPLTYTQAAYDPETDNC